VFIVNNPCLDPVLETRMPDVSAFARVALVTGASRNIGRAIAVSLAEAGLAVAIGARADRGAAEETLRAVEAAGGRGIVAFGDVAIPDDAARMVAETVSAFGRLDVLVNNAAVRGEAALADLTYERWREVTGIILDGAFLLARASLPHLTAGRSGAIINIGGVSAFSGAANRAHVIAAKAGLSGLTRALAAELAPVGITVNLVSPGHIDTQRAGPEPAHHAKLPPIGRKGTPEDIAGMVAYLAGPQARYITGQTIHVNGGMYLT
jgi:3-oxoacyl-[acyl-carrier protein] reductase